MEYIPDPIERLEAWEERMCDEYGNPDGSIRCAGCNEIIDVGECRQVGAAPYGLPVCGSCFHDAYS